MDLSEKTDLELLAMRLDGELARQELLQRANRERAAEVARGHERNAYLVPEAMAEAQAVLRKAVV